MVSSGQVWASVRIYNIILFAGERLLGLSVTTLNALHDGNHEKDLVMAVRGAIGLRRMLLILDDAWTVEDALACQIGGPDAPHWSLPAFPTIATTLGGEPLILHELTSDQSLDLLYLLAPQVVEHEEQKISCPYPRL